MKAGIATVVALSACHGDAPAAATPAQALTVAIDQRVELFSLLERYAGAPEYRRAATPYAHAADAWFAPVKDDPAVVTFRELRASHGISYDAALSLAAQLDVNLAPSQPLSPLPDAVDARWAGVDLAAVLAQVRAFRTASRFDEFLAGQHDYITAVERRLRELVAQRPLATWFDAAFGARGGADYTIAPGLLTGTMSYGLHASPREIEAVIYLEAPDRDGLPTFGGQTESLLAHELAHAYVNPVIHAHITALSGPAPQLASAAPAMARQHYITRENVVDESLVRAITALYLRDRVSDTLARAEVDAQRELGFAWLPVLVDALDDARHGTGGRWTDAQLVAAASAVVVR